MASLPTHAHASWHVEHATSLPEIWANIALFAGAVGAWRLTGVCRAAREGVKVHLRSLPGLVVVYGKSWTTATSDVWRLDLASLQWGVDARSCDRTYQARVLRGGRLRR